MDKYAVDFTNNEDKVQTVLGGLGRNTISS